MLDRDELLNKLARLEEELENMLEIVPNNYDEMLSLEHTEQEIIDEIEDVKKKLARFT